MLNLNSKKNKGFTLVELLVVVAIIGILSSVVLVSLGGARARARLARVQSQMASLHPNLIICINDETSLIGGVPVADTTTLCGGTSSIYPALSSNWSYNATVTTSGSEAYSATTAEGDAWTVRCTETGCITTP